MDYDLWLVMCLHVHMFVFHLVVEYILSSKMYFLSPCKIAEICEFPFTGLIAPPPSFLPLGLQSCFLFL
jgi:hypothetical protein